MGDQTVASITAHPDGVAFSCGGTAWLVAQKCRPHVICTTYRAADRLARRLHISRSKLYSDAVAGGH
jgi:LmbE family N-acetylglucosaminyl deacetylase